MMSATFLGKQIKLKVALHGIYKLFLQISKYLKSNGVSGA